MTKFIYWLSAIVSAACIPFGIQQVIIAYSGYENALEKSVLIFFIISAIAAVLTMRYFFHRRTSKGILFLGYAIGHLISMVLGLIITESATYLIPIGAQLFLTAMLLGLYWMESRPLKGSRI